jgi:hypothetical protein
MQNSRRGYFLHDILFYDTVFIVHSLSSASLSELATVMIGAVLHESTQGVLATALLTYVPK